MTDEQIRQDAMAREAADRADNARKDAQAWQAAENAANRAHQLAVLDAEGRHCEAMARIMVDSSSGMGHPLGVVGRGLEALGITPGDVGALIRKRVDPETPFDRFDRIFGSVLSVAAPIAAAYAEKMRRAVEQDPDPDDEPGEPTHPDIGSVPQGGVYAGVICGKSAITAMLAALAALGYGGAGGDAGDAEEEFAEHVGKLRAEWGAAEADALFRLLMEWLEAPPVDPPADVGSSIDPADFADPADVAEYARRTLAGEKGARVAADIVNRWTKPPADTDGAE
jgi:hypothetical protein